MATEAMHTVISLHGIRTRGEWQKALSGALSASGFVYRPADFGFFSSLSLVNPMSREKKISWFLDLYTRELERTNGPISIVAHSFGSYLVAKVLEDYPEVRFERVIFCGSIVSVEFDWETIINRGQVGEVLNQYARRDSWVRVAQWVVDDAGPAGYKGFTARHPKLFQQLFKNFTHSQYFYDLNFTKNWVPFLQGKGAEESVSLKKVGRNWKFRLVAIGFLLLSVALAIVIGVHAIHDDEGPSEPPIAEPTPESRAQPITEQKAEQKGEPITESEAKPKIEPEAEKIDELDAQQETYPENSGKISVSEAEIEVHPQVIASVEVEGMASVKRKVVNSVNVEMLFQGTQQRVTKVASPGIGWNWDLSTPLF